MEQLFNLEEIIGLTIEKSIFIPDDNKLVLKFNENKFIVFHATNWGDAEINISNEDFCLTPNAYNCDYLLKLGIITDEQCKKIIKDYQDENDRLVREKELKKLNELKQKYQNVI